MALFGQRKSSPFNFFDEGFDDFVINEFDAGSNNTDTDDEDDDIQGMDDNDVEEDDTTTEEPVPDDSDQDDVPQGMDDEDIPEGDPEAMSDTGEENPVGNSSDNTGDDTTDTEDLGMDDTETPDDSMDTNTDDSTGESDPNADTSMDGGETGDDEGLDTIDDDSDGMDDGGSDDGSDEGLEDDSSMDTPENDPHQKLKDLEAEIFDQLSEPEKEMKISELKKLFGVLIDKADSLYKLTQEINKTDDNVKMIDYVLNTLMDLKTYLKDYVVDVYDNRTYLQNSVNFQKFLTIFDAIHSIFKEIKKQFDREED